MSAPNIAVNHADDPRSRNEVNELTKKSTFSGRKDTTIFRLEGDKSRI